jgi:hypothetical protein
MSWLYSQALVAEYSAASCSDGVPCAPSSSTHTQRAYLWHGKTTDAWPRFPSGMTCEPLTDDHGEAVLTWYLAGSPVRTSAPPERVQDSKASDPDYGLRWPESSARFDRDTCLWKIHPCLFPEDSMSCSVTLTRWGTMRDGELSERIMPELPTSGTEYGLLPTPCVRDNKGPSARAYQGNPENLSDIALHGGEKWPTPCARDHKGVSGSGRQAKRGNPQDTLCNAVAGRTWPTPAASEVIKIPATANYGQKGLNNHPAIRGNPIREKMQKNRKGMDGGAKTRQTAGLAQLNPTWVEWLMGWPLEWTDLKPLATDKFREWLRSHGVCSPAKNDNEQENK